MTRRGTIAVTMIVAGVVLMGFAYFGGAAPWCADEVACSNPRMDWSPALFVLGVMVAISSALYYEIAKDPATKDAATMNPRADDSVTAGEKQ
jgi:drug/metabolite transporter (DMT)-like permease